MKNEIIMPAESGWRVVVADKSKAAVRPVLGWTRGLHGLVPVTVDMGKSDFVAVAAISPEGDFYQVGGAGEWYSHITFVASLGRHHPALNKLTANDFGQ